MSSQKPSFDTEVTLVRDHGVLVGVDRAGSLPHLEIVRGAEAPRKILIAVNETVIGRAQHATICIDSSFLSRQHALIQKVGHEFRLRDLDSANGVYLNGLRVHSARLHEGDTIQIGDVVFVFHEGTA